MKYGTIYIIKNTINDNVYIGQTTMSIRDRWMLHRRPSTIETKGNYKFYEALQRYGEDAFYYETLEDDVLVGQLDDREIYYIEKFDSFYNGYNSTKGGKGSLINKKDDINNIVERYVSGESASEISETFNVHSMTIVRLLHNEGVKLRQDGRKLEEYMLKDIISLTESHTYSEIADIYNVDKRTISRFLKKHGFSKRKSKKSQTTIPQGSRVDDELPLEVHYISTEIMI